MSPGFKDFAKDLIINEINDHKADIKDYVVQEVEDMVKDKAGEMIQDRLSDQDLQKIAATLNIPIVHDKVDNIVGRITKDVNDADDLQDFFRNASLSL